MSKVLIVDDDEAICRMFADMLERQGFLTATENDGRQLIPALRHEQFDAVLLDLRMPYVDSFDLLRQLKQSFEDLPVIIVTGYGSIDTAVESMRTGAADFVTKPVDASVLTIRLQRAIEHANTKRLANTDGLTGLYNHRTFQERVQHEVERASRYHRPLSLIMVDIDHFKVYNDTHGHPQGDRVLVDVAHTLLQLSRTSDMVARYGGEEFVLILSETDSQPAEAFGQRLRQAVEERVFPGEAEMPGHTLTISVGIAGHTPPDTKETLIKAADIALYQAKRAGRNRVVLQPVTRPSHPVE